MGGGLLQIAAYGAQDVYLTGDPQITFFKVVYRRHTNFSMEAIQQHFSGKIGFGKSDISTTISRNGDLINSMYLQVTLPPAPNGWTWIDSVGHRLIKSVRINLGGDTIDEHNGRWLEIWDQLTHDATSKDAYSQMTGKQGIFGHHDGGQQLLFIPLMFWFNRNPGLSLPLIALQYHEVKVVIDFEDLPKLVTAPAAGNWSANSINDVEKGGPYGSNTATQTTDSAGLAPYTDAVAWAAKLQVLSSEFKCELYVDYVYLDTEERKRFSQMSHEYLIDQLQIQGKETITSYNHRCKLNFNHPVKELIWVFEPPENPGNGTAGILPKYASGYYSGDATEETFLPLRRNVFGHFGQAQHNTAVLSWLKDAKLQINGHDRFTTRPGEYFSRVQPWQHHSGSPSVPIFVYSFALRPEEFQPSGTCNFSRIDNAYLEVNLRKLLGDHDYSINGNAGAFSFIGETPTGNPANDSGRYLEPAYYAKTSGNTSGSNTEAGFVDGDVGWQNGSGNGANQVGYYKLPADSSNFVAGKSLNMFVYAVSYNVLKIVSGRGGLAYSN